MPLRAPHPCGHPGCPALVRDGARCSAHRVTHERREKEADPFYKRSAWLRLRAVVLRRDPLCPCGAPATVVDHITPRDEGGAEYDEANLRSLCASCHARLPGHGFSKKGSAS